VLIVVPEGNSYAYNVALELQKGIKHQSNITTSTNLTGSEDVVIALGSSIYSKISKHQQEIIATFVPYQGINVIPQPPKKHHYIYAEPSPEQIHKFISSNFISAKVGYLYTDKDKSVAAELEKEFEKSGNSIFPMMHEGDVFSSIRKLIRSGIDIMLINKNSSLYTPKNIRTIIEALTRKRIPVISTTKSLVNLGATVSITSDQSEIIEMTSDLTNHIIKGNHKEANRSGHTHTVNVESNHSMISLFRFDILEGSLE
jgi:ABC-type uncharacterized transport system substrate-binding protein